MKAFILISFFILSLSFFACQEENLTKKNQIVLSHSSEEHNDELVIEHSKLPIQPNKVLVTGLRNHRLVTIYKEKITKDGKRRFIDGNYYHKTYNYNSDPCNVWNGHFMPGIEAVYGFKMFNIAHYNIETKKRNYLFDKSVLVKTLYFPSEEQDTLNCEPVSRNYYMVSVYDEDTNKDSIINTKDLRRFYKFDIEGKNKSLLIPKNYSVIKSEYDSQNDDMYIFAQLDKNSNGSKDKDEPIHIFLLDLGHPKMAEKLF